MSQQTLSDTTNAPHKNDLKTLAAASGPCLTVLMPWHSTGDARETQTRLKGLVRQVEQALDERGLDAETRKALLDGFNEAIPQAEAHTKPAPGFAIYVSKERQQAIALPSAVDEKVILANHFFLRPLLGLSDGHTFYILALSQKHIRLLRCTDHSSEEVPLPAGTPTDLNTFNSSDKPDHDLIGRGSAGPAQSSGLGAIQSTTDTTREDRDLYLHDFYKAIDRHLHEIFRHETAPLVLAGVSYELSIYQKVNSYGHLSAECVHGAPDGLKGGELHKRALEAASKSFSATREKYLNGYDKSNGAGKASTSVKEIVKAAYDGRVSQLFITEGGMVSGSFDESTDRVRTHGQPHLGDEDLLNAAVIQTMMHAGEVFLTPHREMPGNSHLAAIFRY